MKQSVNFSAFVDAFHAFDRYENFGYDGLRIIFDYLEEYEEDTGEELELDVIAICCDYNMMDIATIASEYRIDIEGMDDEEKHDAVIEYLNDNTSVVGETDDGQVVFAAF